MSLFTVERLVCILIFLCSSKVNGQFFDEKFCASLYEANNLEGNEFPLLDGESLTDSNTTEGTLKRFPWKKTKSLKVDNGCSLTACNQSDFNGFCQKFTADNSETPAPVQPFLSVNCTCTRECKCNDIFIGTTSCARAYINTGCNTCNRFYTELKATETEFQTAMRENVKSVIIRNGCILTVFERENWTGNQQDFTTTIEEWTSPIGSYKCVCVQVPFTETRKPNSRQHNRQSPIIIDIPSTIPHIKQKMTAGLENHPGLVAALKSLEANRSSTNAYILVLGLIGAGKSSTINMLFDNANITEVRHDSSSTTKDIIEYRIPVPLHDLGINNSELRIIDSAGLGDGRGVEYDAMFLATLDNFLATHAELNNRIPNIVLIVSPFSDNRFEGPQAHFTKMLRGLDSFRDRITDQKFSNVIFVFSYFMSGTTKTEQRRPQGRLNIFKSVIERWSSFPRPISTALVENKPVERHLTRLNGYYKLPNNRYYPRNLYEKIKKATRNGGDPIGEAVMQAAFSNPDNFNVRSSRTRELESPDPQILRKYESEMLGRIPDTEVSQRLAAAANTPMAASLKNDFPNALPNLQRILKNKNILTNADIPQRADDVVRLLRDIEQNDENTLLMEEAFGLKSPVFPENITGYGYNVIEDRPLEKTPFAQGAVRGSDIGYMFPAAVTCDLERNSGGIFKLVENREEYVRDRLRSLNIDGATIPLDIFNGDVQPGYNIFSEIMENNTKKISAVKEYRTFELTLNDDLKLDDEFKKTVKSLPKYKEGDNESVESWKNFFEDYGTHLVKSAHGGGSIEITMTSNSTTIPKIVEAMFKFIEFLEDTSMGRESNISFETPDVDHQLKFRGGDAKFRNVTDFKFTSPSEAAELVESWKESVPVNPVILCSDMHIVPIGQVAQKLGKNTTSEIQNAGLALFGIATDSNPDSKMENTAKDRVETGEESLLGGGQNEFTRMLKTVVDKLEVFEMQYNHLLKERQEVGTKHHEIFEEIKQQNKKAGVTLGRNNLLAIGFGVGALLAFGVLLVCAVYQLKCLRDSKRLLRELTSAEIDIFKKGIPKDSREFDPSDPLSLPFDHRTYEIALENLEISKKLLGSGEFGNIFEGFLKKNGDKITVAVKTVSQNADVNYFKALLSELKIMCFVSGSPHIVYLVGACTQNIIKRQVYIVMEHCEKGNLLNNLREHRSDFIKKTIPRNTSLGYVAETFIPPIVREFMHSDLLSWAIQIAEGMEYLASKKVVHGDLAARNILLTAVYQAKITDFGLSKQLYKDIMYKKEKQNLLPLPWKWMAIESIRDFIFSTEADMWSFGITLWEIFSLAEVPYPGITYDQTFIPLLASGHRNSKPEHASENLYKLMLSTWQVDPKSRPTFQQMIQQLHLVDVDKKQFAYTTLD